jgi:NhaC family Na+:H+ antiporter
MGIVVLATIAGLAAAYTWDVPLAAGFSTGLIVLIGFARAAGFKPSEIGRSMLDGIGHTKEVIWLLLLVAVIIPAWAASGTLGQLVGYGLTMVSPQFFLTISFVLCTMISMLLGTSTGTLSSIGIPLMGMASHWGIPLPAAAGAVISGAFVGDRTSPFSSAHQLVAASTGNTVSGQWKAMAPTTIGAILAATAFFVYLDLQAGRSNETHYVSSQTVAASGIYYLIPAVVLFGSLVCRIKTKYGFMLSIASAMIVGSATAGIRPMEWLHIILFGADGTAAQGKGLLHMMSQVALIALAGAFNGILERSQIVGAYIGKLMGGLHSLTSATWRTGAFGLGLCLISCTQTLPVMMSGRNILPLWKERFDTAQLARIIADTSLVFAAMVPWNLLAVLCSTLVGLPVEMYVPYCIFLWILPLFTMLQSLYRDRFRPDSECTVRFGHANHEKGGVLKDGETKGEPSTCADNCTGHRDG